jgi:hypothetical protein
MKHLKKFESENYYPNFGEYLEEIKELLYDFNDEGIRYEVSTYSYQKPTFQIYINLDSNLQNHLSGEGDKSELFNEYSDKMIFVLNNMKDLIKRLQDIDFEILICEFNSTRGNDYFEIQLSKSIF